MIYSRIRIRWAQVGSGKVNLVRLAGVAAHRHGSRVCKMNRERLGLSMGETMVARFLTIDSQPTLFDTFDA